jgi:hypothetical protein
MMSMFFSLKSELNFQGKGYPNGDPLAFLDDEIDVIT